MSITIKFGQQGPQVRELQQKLIAAKALDAVAADGTSNDDGVFGRLTEQAVKKFQRDNELEADGIVGRATRAALGLASAAAPTATPSAKSLFTESQRLRLAEKLDGLIPTGPVDLFDDALFMWVVKRMEAVLVAHLPQSFVDKMNDLSDGVDNLDEFKDRLTQLINEKVNIPLLSEKVEEKLFGLLIDIVVDALNLGRRLKDRLGS